MTTNEVVALAALVISIGTNVALYTHLSSTMNSRFDSSDRKTEALERKMESRFESVERRLEMIQGDIHSMDIRITNVELGKS